MESEKREIETKLHLLHEKNLPILEQLRLEEALLRTSSQNWCLINEGSPPAIVLGISGKVEELVDENVWEKKPIPLIRRFSGGGTVIVDEKTLFISFLFQTEEHEVHPYPEPILRWSEELYKECLPPSFHLRENDYAIGVKKCGGNAQYIRKNNWVHHTTFLWDYSPEKMAYLLHPKKTPSYREGRSHTDFLTPLCNHLESLEGFIAKFKKALAKRYEVKPVSLQKAREAETLPHRQATKEEFFALPDPMSI